MEILEVNMNECRLYSPFSGELIYDAAKDYLNEKAKSFVAFWHYDSENLHDYYTSQLVDDDVQFFLPGISSNHDDLLRSWEDYLIDCSHQGENPGEAAKVDLEEFIRSYETLSSLICFRLNKPDKPKQHAYIVLRLDGTIHET